MRESVLKRIGDNSLVVEQDGDDSFEQFETFSLQGLNVNERVVGRTHGEIWVILVLDLGEEGGEQGKLGDEGEGELTRGSVMPLV